MTLAACGTGTTSPSPTTGPTPGPGDTAAPTTEPGLAGGTIYIFTSAEEFDDIDPQRAYTGEDLAFFGATIMRSLTSYVYSPDAAVANGLQPDLAAELGTPNADFTQFSFTLRDGLTWQDGSELTCEDVKYGVSRTFATDTIAGGPTFAIQYLDIPKDDEGESQYKGPYTGEGQALFDDAVKCDGKTITFRLNQPVPDFNYTVTLGFSPVPKAKDTGESYTNEVFSNGPYKIEKYEKGNGGSLVLVRNENWNPASDTVRKAYPDRWEVLFGIDGKIGDQRLIASQGNDAFAIGYGGIQPENLTQIFKDPETPNPEFEGRAFSDYDPYALYYWIDTKKVSNVKHRQAIAVALDRDAIRINSGGAFAGALGDGVIKPNIGIDYAPTGMWTGLLGKEIPDTGDPEYAKQLIAESGEPMPNLTWDYGQTDTRDKEAAIVVSSLARAGINVTANPIPRGQYYGIVFDDQKAHEFGWAGWGPDWPNAATVIAPLFTNDGGWNLSRVTDPEWVAKVQAALKEFDREKQAKMWQDLNKEAMEKVFAIPTTFGLSQTLAGDKVGGLYPWAPYGSWPYGELYVKP
jgi:peptide/nickel transport system substrate-binding protein